MPAAALELRRPRGRPRRLSDDALGVRIRALANSREGLFRIHLRRPDLYASARRRFGSWAAAVRALGLDYDGALREARQRSRRNLRRSR
jgi:hypothetical protein